MSLVYHFICIPNRTHSVSFHFTGDFTSSSLYFCSHPLLSTFVVTYVVFFFCIFGLFPPRQIQIIQTNNTVATYIYTDFPFEMLVYQTLCELSDLSNIVPFVMFISAKFMLNLLSLVTNLISYLSSFNWIKSFLLTVYVQQSYFLSTMFSCLKSWPK